MPIVFSHVTALELLYSNPILAKSPRISGSVDFPSHRKISQALTDELTASPPYHVVCQGKARTNSSNAITCCHEQSKRWPNQCLIETERCLICSPELCFLQTASLFPLADVLLLGFFLCGDYRKSETRRTYGNRPLSSVESLKSFIRLCSGAKGAKRSQQALLYIRDNSHSPLESRLALILSLPPRLGGYGFSAPDLNAPIPGTNREGDICWLEHHVVIEYDSREYHSPIENQQRDAIRRAEVMVAGFDVISVTWAQASNLALLDAVAEALARKTNNSRIRASWKRHEPQRIALHNKLFRQKRDSYFRSLPV